MPRNAEIQPNNKEVVRRLAETCNLILLDKLLNSKMKDDATCYTGTFLLQSEHLVGVGCFKRGNSLLVLLFLEGRAESNPGWTTRQRLDLLLQPDTQISDFVTDFIRQYDAEIPWNARSSLLSLWGYAHRYFLFPT